MYQKWPKMGNFHNIFIHIFHLFKKVKKNCIFLFTTAIETGIIINADGKPKRFENSLKKEVEKKLKKTVDKSFERVIR